jgi:hypothetical protein
MGEHIAEEEVVMGVRGDLGLFSGVHRLRGETCGESDPVIGVHGPRGDTSGEKAQWSLRSGSVR